MQVCAFGYRGDQVVNRLAGERLPALGDEQPGRRIGGERRRLSEIERLRTLFGGMSGI